MRKPAPPTRPGRNGGTLRNGSLPGNKGGSGRPPDAFKELCRGLATAGAVALQAEKVMQNPKHPAFLSALRWATENGYGKPAQPITGADGGPLEVIFTSEA